MNEVIVTSRLDSFNHVDTDKALISINTVSMRDQYSREHKSENWHDMLVLWFDDIVPSYLIADPEETTFFDESMAEQILEFVEKHQDRDFVIHCDAGISRSVAVGSWMKFRFKSKVRLLQIRDDRFRNALVWSLLYNLDKYESAFGEIEQEN